MADVPRSRGFPCDEHLTQRGSSIGFVARDSGQEHAQCEADWARHAFVRTLARIEILGLGGGSVRAHLGA
jgi:hypothetical protein